MPCAGEGMQSLPWCVDQSVCAASGPPMEVWAYLWGPLQNPSGEALHAGAS